MPDLITVLNTIRSNASQEYQARIPEATRTNLESIRYALTDDDNVQVANEFVRTLLNKIVKTMIHKKIFKNPLKALKQGKKPLGDGVEEIYTNFLKGNVADQTGQALLTRSLPDTKVVYHRMNYEQQYPITIDRTRLSKAFVTYDNLNSYIQDFVDKLYSSADLDEFINMKQLIGSAYEKGAMKKVSIKDPLLSEANGKEFIKTIKTISGLMCYPSTEFNGYLTAQTTDTKPITTFSKKDEQILILDTATDVSVNVDVLASLFNMSVAEFNDTKKIVIDTFPVANMRAVLIDKEFLQVWDDYFVITDFFNGQGLYTNYWLNVGQTLAYSILVNAVAFVVEDEAEQTAEE